MKKTKEEKLAEALRANLKRRKQAEPAAPQKILQPPLEPQLQSD